ncbi:C3a anaphylatoxin chemotactic receptor-like [Hypanus sabinus]|uniref:C3a anaphylatoxin chemotactic receptor-like n=1 Tax=Hypanus sabinus TaxID=79690 RepID=UPI0028C4106B|nr:C3a anaphylatoxin chemotactic receptor-like [Hypanus sabinus]
MSLSEGTSNSTLIGNLPSYNSTDSPFSMEWGAPSVLSIVIIILSILLGVPGNGAVIWVTGFKLKTTAHTVFFLNLAVADLMYCLLLPFLMIRISQLHSGYFSNINVKLCISIMYLNAFASVNLLCLISIYRCLAVTRPIWIQQHLKLAWVRVNCFVAWVIAIAMWLTIHFSSYPFNTIPVVMACCFGPPFVIMVISYAVVGWRLHGKRFAKSWKPIRLIVIAVAAFVICWFPFSLCVLLIRFYIITPVDWYRFTQALASFNSALNPLIYVFAGSDFRQLFKRSLFASLKLAFIEHELQGETPNHNPTSDRNV